MYAVCVCMCDCVCTWIWTRIHIWERERRGGKPEGRQNTPTTFSGGWILRKREPFVLQTTLILWMCKYDNGSQRRWNILHSRGVMVWSSWGAVLEQLGLTQKWEKWEKSSLGKGSPTYYPLAIPRCLLCLPPQAGTHLSFTFWRTWGKTVAVTMCTGAGGRREQEKMQHRNFVRVLEFHRPWNCKNTTHSIRSPRSKQGPGCITQLGNALS